MKHLLTLVTLVSLVIVGCKEKANPVTIDELHLNVDEPRKFEVKTPKNWFTQKVPGELVLAVTSKEVSRRFSNFAPGTGGAKVELRVLLVDSTRNLDSIVKNSKLEFRDKLDRYKRSNSTLGGKPAIKLEVAFDQTDGEYRQEIWFAEQDSVITMFSLAAFGGTFADYSEEFKEIYQSVKLAKREVVAPKTPQVDTTKRGPEPPSDTLRSYSAPDFVMQIPQNFSGSRTSTPGTISSMSFSGSRLDCTIQIDVFDASKQKDLAKILDQNKASYGGGSPSSTTLAGQKAAYFNYNANAQVASRAYFMVKGDRMFRITMNWYKPDQNLYLPIFEKCLGTLKPN